MPINRNLLFILLLLVGGIFVACRTPEPTPTPTVTATTTKTSTPTVTSSATLTSTATASPTATFTSTATATATFTPIPEGASLPTPTLNPTMQSWRDLFMDDEALASLYPDSVELVRTAEDSILAVNLTMGFAFGFPPDRIMFKEVDTDYDSALYSGVSLMGGGEYYAQFGFFDSSKQPDMQDLIDFVENEVDHSTIGYGDTIQNGQETISINGVDVEYLYYLTSDGQEARYDVFLIALEDYSPDEVVMSLYMMSNVGLSEYDAVQEMAAAKNQLMHSYQTFIKNNVARDLLPMDFYILYAGLCPTDTDETFGYTVENPIKVASYGGADDFETLIMGPHAEKQYLETLLYNGQQIEFVRRGSTSGEEAILDIYELTGPGIDGSITLYVDMYNAAPYRVPAGFGCTGLLHADYVLGVYQGEID